MRWIDIYHVKFQNHGLRIIEEIYSSWTINYLIILSIDIIIVTYFRERYQLFQFWKWIWRRHIRYMTETNFVDYVNCCVIFIEYFCRRSLPYNLRASSVGMCPKKEKWSSKTNERIIGHDSSTRFWFFNNNNEWKECQAHPLAVFLVMDIRKWLSPLAWHGGARSILPCFIRGRNKIFLGWREGPR